MNRLPVLLALLSSLAHCKVWHTPDKCLFPFPALVRTLSACHRESDDRVRCDINSASDDIQDYCVFGKQAGGCLPEFTKMSRLRAYGRDVRTELSTVEECEQTCSLLLKCIGFDFTLTLQCHLYYNADEFADTYEQSGTDHYVREPCMDSENTGVVCLTECKEGTTTGQDDTTMLACWAPVCPVHGQWSAWSDWDQCSKTCDDGKHIRVRSCDKPAPRNNGDLCVGPANENRPCQMPNCSTVDGGWTDWTDWTTCSDTCGDGTATRMRQCTRPRPSHGGATCAGMATQWQTCFLLHCFGLPVSECGPNCWHCDVIAKSCEQDGCALGYELAANGTCEPESLTLEDVDVVDAVLLTTIENSLWAVFGLLAVILLLLCFGLVYGLARKRRTNVMPPVVSTTNLPRGSNPQPTIE